MEWQPIETAAGNVDGECLIAQDGSTRIAISDGEGRFYHPETGDSWVEYYDPTHWMALPAPPDSAGLKGIAQTQSDS